MIRQGKVHCTRDILSLLLFSPVDYYYKRFCAFQEDAIMTQQHSPRTKSVVTMTAVCVILTVLCCNLPQVDSLGSECYTITGLDYRGKQDIIGLPPEAGELLQHSNNCLTWNSSIESRKPRARERGIGSHNYCRNPDGDILPWCRVKGIEGAEGAWGYCHIPKCEVPGYLGCFPDRGSPSALDGEMILHKDMTVSSCITFCRQNGFKYAGLEAGHVCYCGNSGYNRYGKSAERGTHCAEKCFGNKGQPCGGDGYVDVYRTDIGSCGTDTSLRLAAGAIYSPGYPDFPGSSGMMTSLGGTVAMLRKYKDQLLDKGDDPTPVEKLLDQLPKTPDDSCAWEVNIRQASEIKTIIKKIDSKRKLGGVIEIEAVEGSSLSLATAQDSIVTSQIIWLVESSKSRHELEAIVPPEGALNQSDHAPTPQSKRKSKWSHSYGKTEWPRYSLPTKSLDPVLSIKGGNFIVRFTRNTELMNALKNVFAFTKERSRSRRRSVEWSRFVIEYEAVFPEGVIYNPDENDVTVITDTSSNNDERQKKSKHTKSQPGDPDIGDLRFTISTEEARAIRQAMAGKGMDASVVNGSKSITINVVVGNIGDEEKDESQKHLSDTTTQTLLFVVLATTTTILILCAIMVLYRRRLFPKKTEKSPADREYSRSLVVACPQDGDTEKSGSNSNLSSSSTADSVLLTDSESKYSPSRSRKSEWHEDKETTLDDVIKFLKSQPGLIQSAPTVDMDHKQSAGHHCFGMTGDSRHDDVTPLPGPCAHCCGCTDDNRAHRHGDSCRAHHNQAKFGRSQGSSRGKNPRGLSIRPSKQVQQPSIAPPLSPISEVSSVTSSMLSLPITSANSQTSLLRQKTPTHKPTKKDNSKISDVVTSESDVEYANEIKPNRGPSKATLKASFNGHKGQKLDAGHFASGPFGACYDSGYATSNYEDDTSSIVKDDDVTNNITRNDVINS